jgi:hypothetical protein
MNPMREAPGVSGPVFGTWELKEPRAPERMERFQKTDSSPSATCVALPLPAAKSASKSHSKNQRIFAFCLSNF